MLDIQSLVMGELLQVFSAFIHRPQVHGSVAIGQEIDPAIPPHRVLAGAAVVGGQGDCFVSAVKFPEGLRGSALVTLCGAALGRQPREEERAAARIVASMGRLAERDDLYAIVAVDCGQLSVRQGRVPSGRVQYLSVWGPPYDAGIIAVEGSSDRQTAGGVNSVDLGWPLVACGE